MNPIYKTKEWKNNISKNHADVKGENHPQARPVILISPEGIEYKLPCYAPFCREHNLGLGHIYEVLNGKRKHHKSWTGKYLKK